MRKRNSYKWKQIIILKDNTRDKNLGFFPNESKKTVF